MRDIKGFIQRYDDRIATPLELITRAGNIDQNASHQLGGHGKKVRAIPPLDTTGIDQPQISLVYECSGLQHVAGPFSRHIPMRQSLKFVMNDRHQTLERLSVSGVPAVSYTHLRAH